ncbi:hypothetical protein [Stenotrophomonas sp. PS02289]|uniref:hypothetical protein n=1 Tax=Stenotrophomonas sp. PS02289 TaxID=2991422 RepID=UPI00249C641E|nr:hypothetical protein [Stenotrophomonas sp. PS02289]
MSKTYEGSPLSDHLQGVFKENISGETPQKGSILKTLLTSPLIGSELEIPRPFDAGRKVDL